MYRYHVEVMFEDGSVYVYSVEYIDDIVDYFAYGIALHGNIILVKAERDYYDSPVGISNQ